MMKTPGTRSGMYSSSLGGTVKLAYSFTRRKKGDGGVPRLNRSGDGGYACPCQWICANASFGAYNLNKYSVRQLAENFNVAKGTVKKLIRLFRETGSLVPRKSSPPELPIWTDTNLHQIVRDMVAEDNDGTLAEYCDRLEKQTGTRISVQRMCDLLQQLKLYRKKNSSGKRGRLSESRNRSQSLA